MLLTSSCMWRRRQPTTAAGVQSKYRTRASLALVPEQASAAPPFSSTSQDFPVHCSQTSRQNLQNRKFKAACTTVTEKSAQKHFDHVYHNGSQLNFINTYHYAPIAIHMHFMLLFLFYVPSRLQQKISSTEFQQQLKVKRYSRK